jgi:hypothetical protein
VTVASLLGPELKERYLRELERDRALPFNTEWARTVALERRIIDQHGEAGARLLVERSTRRVAGGRRVVRGRKRTPHRPPRRGRCSSL